MPMLPRLVRSLAPPLAAAAVAAALVLAFSIRSASAGGPPVPEKALPAPAGTAVQPAVTLWVDVGGKRAEAAARLSATHAELAARGYVVVSVVAHVENGDFQGFFATYGPAR